MLFLIIYLEARSPTLRLRYLKALLQVTAFVALFTTCISRITDYFHKDVDVVGGGILGALIAILFTIVLGRVLWEYNTEERYSDFDLDPRRVRNPIYALY
jgi:membrane-associated phospholipid phosphatase